MNSLKEYLYLAVWVCIVLFLVALTVFLFMSARAETEYRSICLANGYPEFFSMRFFTDGTGAYCIRLINQSDEVVPVRDLMRR